MSYDEKQSRNRWRFSREISFGDLVVAVGLVVMVANIKFKVDDHERRLTTVETAQVEQSKRIEEHGTAIAVLQARSPYISRENKQPN